MRHRNPVGVGARLKQIRGERSQAEFAEQLGFHKNTYADWEREKAEVSASALERLSGLGVSADWVLTGLGPMRLREPEVGIVDLAKGFEPGRGFPPSQPARLDPEKLRFALEVVEEALAATGRTADPAGKAHLVAKIYETFLQEADVAKATATVLRLIRTGT